MQSFTCMRRYAHTVVHGCAMAKVLPAFTGRTTPFSPALSSLRSLTPVALFLSDQIPPYLVRYVKYALAFKVCMKGQEYGQVYVVTSGQLPARALEKVLGLSCSYCVRIY